MKATRSKDIEQTTASFAGVAAALADPRQRIEDAFIAVGDLLGRGAATLNALYREFEALPAHLQSQEVEDATARLRQVSATCIELSDAFAHERGELDRLVERVASAASPLSDLQRAVKIMSILAINARVAAAGIAGDRDGFDVFTTDITTLSRSANEAIEDFSRIYRHLTGQVSNAAAQRAAFEARHANTLKHLAGRLDRTIDELDGHRRVAMEGSAETGAISRQISQRVAAGVMSLQVGDASRQRLEHIEAGLVVADGEGGDAVAALELAQLTDTIAQFGVEISRIEQALTDLAGDAALIRRRSADIYAAGEGGGTSMVGALSAQLLDTVAMLRDCEAERGKMEAIAGAVQDSAGLLMGHIEVIQEIEASMRLVSLNAAVKCAQLGPLGAALSIIAAQLRELTFETISAADAAVACLGDASDLALAFAKGSAGAGAGRIGALEQEARAALGLLSDLDTKLARALGMLEKDGPAVVATLREAAGALSGQAGIVELMEDACMQLVELGASDALDAPSDELDAILGPIAASYTMDAERAVHRKLFGSLPQAAAAAASPADDLDFLL